MKLSLRTAVVGTALALSVFGLSACSSGSSDAGIVGVWGTPDTAGETSIEFETDGNYFGTDGCNQIGGSWEADAADEHTIDLGLMRSTMMACADVDTWLTGATTAVVQGDQLVFTDAQGKELGTLNRN